MRLQIVLLAAAALSACTPAMTIRQAAMGPETLRLLDDDKTATRYLVSGTTHDGRTLDLRGAHLADGLACSHWMTPACLPLSEIAAVKYEEHRLAEPSPLLLYPAAAVGALLFFPFLFATPEDRMGEPRKAGDGAQPQPTPSTDPDA